MKKEIYQTPEFMTIRLCEYQDIITGSIGSATEDPWDNPNNGQESDDFFNKGWL